MTALPEPRGAKLCAVQSFLVNCCPCLLPPYAPLGFVRSIPFNLASAITGDGTSCDGTLSMSELKLMSLSGVPYGVLCALSGGVGEYGFPAPYKVLFVIWAGRDDGTDLNWDLEVDTPGVKSWRVVLLEPMVVETGLMRVHSSLMIWIVRMLTRWESLLNTWARTIWRRKTEKRKWLLPVLMLWYGFQAHFLWLIVYTYIKLHYIYRFSYFLDKVIKCSEACSLAQFSSMI